MVSLLSADFLFWSCLSSHLPAERPFLPCRKNPSDSKGGRSPGCQPRAQSSVQPRQPLSEQCWLWELFMTLLRVCVGWLSSSGGATITRMLVLCVLLSGHLEHHLEKSTWSGKSGLQSGIRSVFVKELEFYKGGKMFCGLPKHLLLTRFKWSHFWCWLC